MGSYDTGIKTLITSTNLHTSAPTIAATGVAAQQGDKVGAGIGLAQIGITVAQTAGKDVPVLGTLASGLSLGNNVKQLTDQYNEDNGNIKTGTVLAAASDLAALGSGVAGAIATGAVAAGATVAGIAAAPAAAAVAVGLAIAAAGVAAQKGEVGSTLIGGAQIVVTGIETLGKSVPYAGPLLSGTSLVSNSIDIGNQYHDKNEQVETQNILTVIIHAPSHAQNLTSTKNWQTLRPTLVDRS